MTRHSVEISNNNNNNDNNNDNIPPRTPHSYHRQVGYVIYIQR